ncbi:MAG: thiamine diphosphokinase [Clostridiales bacterium]|nr:thiamine diphosphokinase [Clostridiales bacterium]
MRVLIITGYLPEIEKIKIKKSDFDYIITADRGHEYADILGISPDVKIGDFDSSHSPAVTSAEVIHLPVEKSMTDTEAALDIAATVQPSSVTILGGLGGRFDHAMGNISILSKYDFPVEIIDSHNSVKLLNAGEYIFEKKGYKYISLISYSSSVSGIDLSGVKYPLSNSTLYDGSTLGISNEILFDKCLLSFKSGQLLICQSND